jgi:hypothetical protein
LLKIVKSFCKSSDSNLRLVFDAAMLHLAKPHAQIRLATLQLIDELFSRSHLFRQLVVANYTAITNLALGINGGKLPSPETWAKMVKTLGLVLIKEWNDKFGPGYKQLEIGFNQLRATLRLETFPGRVALIDLEFEGSKEKQEAEARRAERRRKDYEDVLVKIEDAAPSMRDALETIVRSFSLATGNPCLLVETHFQKSCIGILVPADPLFATQDTEPEAEAEAALAAKQNAKDFARSHGMGSVRYTLDIDLSEINEGAEGVHEDQDNAVLFDTLREATKVASKQLKNITEWMSVVQKANVKDKRTQERVIKTLLDRSEAIRTHLERSNALLATSSENRDEEEEEQFEEVVPVPKAPKGPTVVDETPKLFGGPTLSVDSSEALVSNNHEEASESEKPTFIARDPRHAELLRLAPVVDYDRDLDVWDTTEKAFQNTGINYSHRFLGEQQEEHFLSQDTLDNMRKRVVHMKPKEDVVIPACGAPLPKGGLCQRRDLAVCPFHGPIVPRDELGNPLVSQADEDDDGEQPWMALEGDVIQNLGLQDYREKKRKRGDGEPSRLVDLKKNKDTVQSRLKKKLNDPAARRNIAAAYAKEDEYSYRDRNTNSWH